MKKKESGAEGRKRRKLEAEEIKKSNKFFMTFFKKHEARSLIKCSIKSTASTTSLLESEGELSTNASQAEKEVKSHKSEYDKIKSEAVRENMDMTGREDDGDDSDVKFIDEILSDDTELNELNDIEEPRTHIRSN
ncbi:bromodomain adjacent to zinc finger domain protein 2a [Lasius niger]|uniref:Bromodomain adjacent to zinc finger domain protein 2a n=1 Tax=Lasius niger TaxID=67767 RepID=A0A0J7K872_LASNI|nr:bromodomain adjacent to zinc finger domain protein 2a [Lasius niger]